MMETPLRHKPLLITDSTRKDYMDSFEIGALFGRSRAFVGYMMGAYPDFPAPEALGTSSNQSKRARKVDLWLRSEVLAFKSIFDDPSAQVNMRRVSIQHEQREQRKPNPANHQITQFLLGKYDPEYKRRQHQSLILQARTHAASKINICIGDDHD